MTKDEMIRWAGLEGGDVDKLDKLIWIAQNYAKVQVWNEIASRAQITADCFLISSYPQVLKAKND